MVARAMEALQWRGVCTLALHQLTPELAEDIAAARAVIFVDATQEGEASTVEVLSLKPSAQHEFRTHTSDPAALLALSKTLYDRCPPAWLIAVPAAQFEVGTSLSPLAQAGVAAALEKVQALCRSVIPA